MKLFTNTYKSPYPTQGTFENVYIEDVSYKINRNENLLVVKFQMFYENGLERILLDENQLSFRGSNLEYEQGLPTTNKTAWLKVYNPNYDSEIPQYIQIENPDYIAEHEELDSEGNIIIIPANDEFISILNPDYIPETTNYPLKEYLYSNQGQMPENYEILDFGYPTYEDVLQYFTGGNLNNPELFIENPFAREWLKHNLQMKGEYITNFEFIE